MSDGNVPVEASDRQSVLAQASEMERRSPRSLHNQRGAGPVGAGAQPCSPQPPLTGLRGAGLRNPRHRLQGPGLYLLLSPSSHCPRLASHSPRPRARLCMGVTQWPCRSEFWAEQSGQFPLPATFLSQGPSLSQLGFLRNWEASTCPDPARNLSWLVVHSGGPQEAN